MSQPGDSVLSEVNKGSSSFGVCVRARVRAHARVSMCLCVCESDVSLVGAEGEEEEEEVNEVTPPSSNVGGGVIQSKKQWTRWRRSGF
jgi:hypothetical protein